MIDLTHDRSTAEGFQLKPYLAKLRQQIDATLQVFLTGGRFPDARLRVAMQYAIFAGGKRLRLFYAWPRPRPWVTHRKTL